MKIMCLIKISLPLKNGSVPPAFPPSIDRDRIKDGWYINFLKYSMQYLYTQHPNLKNDPTNYNSVLLFNSEEELTTWANNCRLTDPQLIADQETWNKEYGITFTYEYYSLSQTTGPDPLI